MRKIILPVMAGATLLGFSHAKSSATVYVTAPTPANGSADGWLHRQTPWILYVRGVALGSGSEIPYPRTEQRSVGTAGPHPRPRPHE